MKKLQFLLPFFFGASLSAFGVNVTVIDEDGNTVASGGTLYSVVDSLPENVVMISGDITETKTSKFSDIEENMTLTIRGDSSQPPPTIAGNVERVQAVQNSIFQQTGNKKTLTLNVENVTITNPNGYVVCGINVNLNGNNAVFSGCRNPSDGSHSVGQGGVIRTTTNLKANGLSDGASKAGAVTITGTNTFTDNSAGKGGAIYATTTVTFSGDDSVAVFRGNTMSGTDESEYTVAGKNDIFSGGNFAKGVTIKGKGTYIFDGGIRLASTASGKLAVNSGAKVTFEDGAINMITNSTTITGASVRFENGNGINALKHNITIGKNGEMTIAEGAQITMGKSGETFAFSASSEGSVLNIELCDSYIASLGYAAIVGVDGGSNTLSANSITLSATEEYVLDLVLGNAGAYSYKHHRCQYRQRGIDDRKFCLVERMEKLGSFRLYRRSRDLELYS